MAALNYAVNYGSTLDQLYPYSLYFGDLYATRNNQVFRWVNYKTIEVPHISTTGRVDANRDVIGTFQRNVDNDWDPYTLQNHRQWSTLIHPMDIDETNYALSIAKFTKVFNEEQKFPEMDAYCGSKIFADWTAFGNAPLTTTLTTANVLETFDTLMQQMTEQRVPATGRILYVTPAIQTLLKQADGISRSFQVQPNQPQINRVVNTLDQVRIVPIPPELFMTAYDFTTGFAPAVSAKQMHMMLIHPGAVITPVRYNFAQLESPSAMSTGKWVYFEESYEDVFVLKYKTSAIKFVTAA